MADEVKYPTNNFYGGADYGLDAEYGKEFSVGFKQGYGPKISEFSLTTDPRTSNQLKAVSDKLSTGAKNIEVTAVTAATWEAVPEQHLKEIERLKKLAGAELTFHGPVIEPTGARQGWNEGHRRQAERQMWSAVKRAHKLEPDGNVIVTFHSAAGLPEPETRIFNEKTGKEEIKEFWVVDEASGKFANVPIKPDYFKSKEEGYSTPEGQIKAINEIIDKQNKEAWFKQLFTISYHANQGTGVVRDVLGKDEGKKTALKMYEKFLKGKNFSEELDVLEEQEKKFAETQMNALVHGDTYLRESYQDLQNVFNQAYEVAKANKNKDDLEKLNKFRKEIAPALDKLEDVENLQEFGNVLIKGVNVLRSIKPPKALKPLRDFAVDKSSETFSNLALESYKKFKDTAPIISVENPPAGAARESSGMSRAEDLRSIIKESRRKLKDKLVKEAHLSEGNAEAQAEKLIGATWDVGHINMLRGLGYSGKDIVRETEKIAPFVKHVHLSDNFGMEHTELPMGMGNVPIKPMLEAIEKYNKKVKKVIETGTWFGPQAFGNQTPFAETLRAFGSPIYSMQMAPSWNQAYGTSGGYSTGYGQTLPEQHFSMYGSGFSNLPTELGGQMAGRSRVGGTPME
ncbi:MAG: hypothetical protein KJ600_01040 [Nanoarchaeota archaeon]|nr:hypothetical protein [Nanoarchaeota archaeon]MBU1103127.1 hypothetical protein [Nanoarchaeota archaeon]